MENQKSSTKHNVKLWFNLGLASILLAVANFALEMITKPHWSIQLLVYC